jgi:5-methylcytosine-specific restriction endonuclease McrA
MLTLDHKVPKAQGGKDRMDNLVTACKRCNQDKADRTIEEYRKILKFRHGVQHLIFHGEVG